MSRKIIWNIIFNLQHVRNYRLPGNRGAADFSILRYRFKLDTIFHLSLDPPGEKLYRLKKRVFLPFGLSLGGF
jgi:hypothetical protein